MIIYLFNSWFEANIFEETIGFLGRYLMSNVIGLKNNVRVAVLRDIIRIILPKIHRAETKGNG